MLVAYCFSSAALAKKCEKRHHSKMSDSTTMTPEGQIRYLINSTLPTLNATETAEGPPSQLDAFLYIIVVIMFYASALVILMIKYMQGEKHDARLTYYYEEFVKREDFQRKSRRESVIRAKANITAARETSV